MTRKEILMDLVSVNTLLDTVVTKTEHKDINTECLNEFLIREILDELIAEFKKENEG